MIGFGSVTQDEINDLVSRATLARNTAKTLIGTPSYEFLNAAAIALEAAATQAQNTFVQQLLASSVTSGIPQSAQNGYLAGVWLRQHGYDTSRMSDEVMIAQYNRLSNPTTPLANPLNPAIWGTTTVPVINPIIPTMPIPSPATSSASSSEIDRFITSMGFSLAGMSDQQRIGLYNQFHTNLPPVTSPVVIAPTGGTTATKNPSSGSTVVSDRIQLINQLWNEFIEGMREWRSPGVAIRDIINISTFGAKQIGLVAVPAAIAVGVYMFMQRRRGRYE